MSEALLPAEAPAALDRPAVGASGLRFALSASALSLAWRNLWRNRRRSWLMASGIGFAGLLVLFVNGMQSGTFALLVDNTTRFYSGHAQVQHPLHHDEPRVEHALTDASARLAGLASNPNVVLAAPRAQAFALLSAGERSFGGLVVGVDPEREFSSIRRRAVDGRYVESAEDAFVGAVLARNLGIGVGDGMFVVGNSEQGGVAAMSLTVAGVFETGQADFDRSQMHVRLDAFQEAFGLGDRVHAIALLFDDQTRAEELAAGLADADTVALPWQRLLPEIHQMMELKYQTSYMIYALILLLVSFSIVNAFVMTTFDRTAEFGMLKAVGMTQGGLVAMLAWEALWLALLGLAVTLVVVGPLLLAISTWGIPLPAEYAVMTAQYLMPERLYTSLDVGAWAEFSIAVLAATQLAALLPALRLRRMKVVDALRDQE